LISAIVVFIFAIAVFIYAIVVFHSTAPNMKITISIEKTIMHQTKIFDSHGKPFLWNLFTIDFADVAISPFHGNYH